jgi:hypothetical protein
MWTLLLSVGLLAAPPAVEVQSLDGTVMAGGLLELGDKGIKLATERGPVVLEIGKLAGIWPKGVPGGAAPAPAVWLELVDGSSPVGSAYTATEGRARLTLPGGEVLDLATQDVRWVRFQPLTGAAAGQWARILGMDAKSDLLIVKAGEGIDYHKGLLRDVSAETVKFELDGDVLPISRSKVLGLAYYHPAGREMPPSLGTLGETSGATWAVRTIQLAGEKIEWTTPTGLKLARLATAITRIDFSKGKIAYLSDLEPESVEWTPYVRLGKDFPARAESAAPRRDRSRDAGPLVLDGKSYTKGLGLSSRTLVVYRLPERFSRLVATAGIDDRVRPLGHVRLVIRGDDKTLLETTVAGTEPARPLSLDVSGVRRLSILVDFGEDLDVADYLDLGDAKLVK